MQNNLLEIDIAIRDLIDLKSKGSYSMSKISWWLIKYEGLYQNIKQEETIGELKSFNKLNSNALKFRSLYNDLGNLEKFKLMESIFQDRLDRFDSIKGDSEKLNNWLELNNEEALESHFELWFEWTDHDPDKIQPFILYWDHLNIKIPASDFKYTLEALEIFHGHYWE